jgi:hypothetical protein
MESQKERWGRSRRKGTMWVAGDGFFLKADIEMIKKK